jgi:hypothetical protein
MSYLQEHVTISYTVSQGNPTRLQYFTLAITHNYARLYQPLISLNKVIVTAKKLKRNISTLLILNVF